jgi:probable rRNA maturation factor
MSEPALRVEAQLGDGVAAAHDLARLEEVVRFVLREEAVEEAELSLTLLLDVEMAQLNEQYLGHEGTTDVISFPLEGPGSTVVGDIYIGMEQAMRQAEDLAVPADEELLRLAVHGTLHVLGHEHPESDDREDSPMYRRQEELLSRFRSEVTR